jgi:histidinol dehydrogenase
MVVPTPGGERNPLVLAAACAGRRRSRVLHRRRAGGGRAGLRHADRAAGRQDRRPGQRLRGERQAPRVRRRRHRHGRRAVGNPRHLRRQTDPDWVAMDLFSQAEHDELAQSILLARMRPTSSGCARRSKNCCRHAAPGGDSRVAGESRRADRGARSRRGLRHRQPHRAGAPRISLADADAWVAKIRHAGAIFIGPYTSESLGDYCAGPNHVLPTSGSARFSSPLGVYDFQKRSSLIRVSQAAAKTLGRIASTLAKGEGLPAHARSAEYRVARPRFHENSDRFRSVRCLLVAVAPDGGGAFPAARAAGRARARNHGDLCVLRRKPAGQRESPGRRTLLLFSGTPARGSADG